jgi:hypothetical protein
MSSSNGFDSGVLKRLRAPKVKEAIGRVVEEWHSTIEAGRNGLDAPPTDMYAHGVAYRRLLAQRLKDLIEERVFRDLATPYTILATEVCSLAGEFLSVPPEDFARSYDRFVARVASEELGAWVRRLEPVTIHTFDRDELQLIEEGSDFRYTLPSGIELRDAGMTPVASHDDPSDLALRNFRLTIEGRATVAALSEAQREIVPVLRTTLQTFREANLFDVPDVQIDPGADVEEMQAKSRQRLGLFMKTLDLCFGRVPGKKALGGRRVRNAILLLTEADLTRHSMVRLALSMAAMEALLVADESAISESLARNAATLLQPKAGERPRHVTAIKGLYKLRSKIVHGESVDAAGEGADRAARVLASACVVATLQWREWMSRLGEDPDRSDLFLTELHNNGLTGKAMLGVSEELSQLLPG